MFWFEIHSKKTMKRLLDQAHHDGAVQGCYLGIEMGRADAGKRGVILPGIRFDRTSGTTAEQIKARLKKEGII